MGRCSFVSDGRVESRDAWSRFEKKRNLYFYKGKTGPRNRVKEMIKNETGSEGKTRPCQRREHREYEEYGSWTTKDSRFDTQRILFILVFRRENAKSLDILDIPFYENIYQMVITELLPSHSCDHTSMEWKLGSISRSPSFFSFFLPAPLSPSSMRFYVRLSDTFFHYHRFNSSLTT